MPRPSWRIYNKTPAPLRVHHGHCLVQLVTAVAAQRTENITGQALGMDPHQNRFLRIDLPLDQGDMQQVVDIVLIDDRLEIAGNRRGDDGFGGLAHKRFHPHPVFDQIGDRADADAVGFH